MMYVYIKYLAVSTTELHCSKRIFVQQCKEKKYKMLKKLYLIWKCNITPTVDGIVVWFLYSSLFLYFATSEYTLMCDWNFPLEKLIWIEFKMFPQALIGIPKALEFIFNWCYSMHGASSFTNKQHNQKKTPQIQKKKAIP